MLAHRDHFKANELENATSMLQGIRKKYAKRELEDVSVPAVKIDALACWVELVQTYHICVRESQALASRGSTNVTAPNL